jgi:hypothetical protein
MESVKEDCRDVRRGQFVEELFKDLHDALRVFRKTPAFSLAAICTLALGIGACTAIFTVVEGILLRPLPYPEPDRLVKRSPRIPRWESRTARSPIRTISTGATAACSRAWVYI